MMYHSYHPFLGIFGGIASFLFWVLIIILIFRLIRGGRGRRRWHHYMREDDALETLRERFAKGEITKEEYEERKSVLTKD